VELTDAGRALLADARAVSREVGALVARARSLLHGVEAELSFAVDVQLPIPVLTSLLNEFRAAYPSVTLRLHVEAVGAVAQLVLERLADLGVGGPIPSTAEGLEFIPLGAINMVAVAAPNHPLAELAHDRLTAAQVHQHVQLVLTDRSKLSEGQDFFVVSGQTWRLADLGAKHALLLAGVGWGGMPEPMVAADLASGRLVRLPLAAWNNAEYQLRAVRRTDQTLGPAGAWLLERLKALDRAASLR
jgi:DNA-binding transcriptional LysR family regulator